jgi:hypothetical protein
MAIIADLIPPAVLTGYIREMPGPVDYRLNQVLPDQEIGDIEAAIDVLLRTNRAAKFRSYDAETPIGQRDGFQRSRVMLPPVGQKTLVGEQERLLLQQLQTGGFNDGRLVQTIYRDAETNTRAVLARMEVARGDALVDGKVTIQENGLVLEADYGIDPSHLVTAPVLWSNTASASPMDDLHNWVNTYIDDSGQAPGFLHVSRQVLTNMLQSVEIRQLLATIIGAPALVNRQQLQSVLDQYDLPTIVSHNTRIEVDDTVVRPVPTDVAILTPATPSDLGYTAWGITAEALELMGSNDPQMQIGMNEAPGLIGLTLREGEPLRIWTKICAVGMPIITDPRLLFVAKVA